MPNDPFNEQGLYDQLKREGIRVHPVVWELIRHNIANDVQVIQFITELYVSGDDPQSIPPEDGRKLLERCDRVRLFLRKLKDMTLDDLNGKGAADGR